MASIQLPASSGSDGSAPTSGGGGSGSGSGSGGDDRKRKRMLSNRESARRSRQRKQKQMEDLTAEMSRLQISQNQILQSIAAKEQAFFQLDSSNNVLRAQVLELTDRLRSLNSVLQIVEEVSGLAVDMPEIPDPMKPWQGFYPVHPISAAADFDMSLV